MWAKDVPAQESAIEFQDAETDKQEEKPAVVSLAETVVDPGAVVVGFGDAGVAEGAVFATRWFGDVASAAYLGWSVEDVVVGVSVWVFSLRAEIVGFVGDGKVGEDIWQCDQEWRGEKQCCQEVLGAVV